MSLFMPSLDRNALLINKGLMSLAVAVLTQVFIAHLVTLWMTRVKRDSFQRNNQWFVLDLNWISPEGK